MRRISYCHAWQRAVLSAAIFTTGVLVSAIEARGVILYSSDTRNTTAPSAAEGLAAWNLEATWGSFLATPIDATHFIAASHVGVASSTLTFQGSTYTVDAASGVKDPNSDLEIYSIVGGSFPTYATLYNSNPAVDGSEVGKTLTVIGRGTQRGSPVLVGPTLRGWQWGASDGVQSWGQNVVTGFTDYSASSPNSLLYFNFDPNAFANPAALSVGDSSGGVFILANGQWKLAGINYAVSGPFSLTGTGGAGDGFNASIFDARGLYVWNGASWVYDDPSNPNPDPGMSAASSISHELGWIQSVVPDVVVPEPGTVVLLISGALAAAIFGHFRRRKSA